MKILTLLFSLLGLTLLAPVAAAQRPVDVFQGSMKEIRTERVDALADLDSIFELGSARMKALAKDGAAKLEIQRVADWTMQALDRRAKAGVQAIYDVEEEGLALLEQMLAPPMFLKRLEGAATRAVDTVMFRHAELCLQTETLLKKLL